MSIIFASFPAPAPGTEFGPVLLNFQLAQKKKSFSVSGVFDANTVITVEVSCEPVGTLNPTQFATLVDTKGDTVQWSATDQTSVREVEATFTFARIRRLRGTGSGPIVVGLATELECACPTGPTQQLTLNHDPERLFDNNGPSVVFEQFVPFDANPTGQVRVNCILRGNTGADPADIDLELREGGTPGFCDGTLIASASTSAAVAAQPGGIGFSFGDSTLAIAAGNRLVKLCAVVPTQNGFIDAAIRGMTVVYGDAP